MTVTISPIEVAQLITEREDRERAILAAAFPDRMVSSSDDAIELLRLAAEDETSQPERQAAIWRMAFGAPLSERDKQALSELLSEDDES